MHVLCINLRFFTKLHLLCIYFPYKVFFHKTKLNTNVSINVVITNLKVHCFVRMYGIFIQIPFTCIVFKSQAVYINLPHLVFVLFLYQL